MRFISVACVLLLLAGIPVGAAPAEEMRLTVSRLVLAYPQATEDIYCGTVPAREITWCSSNPAVIEVNDGVVTAVAPGEAEITASWNGQVSSCSVSCLTGSAEEFRNFYGPELRQPMRTPVEPQPGACHFYDDAGFIGDSVTYQLLFTQGREEAIGSPVPLFRRSASVKGFTDYSWNVMFRGAEWKIEEAVAASGVNKVFIMLGANDLGVRSPAETFDNFQTMIDRIREKAPQVEIYIESVLPSGLAQKSQDTAAYNELLRQYASDNQFHFVEVAKYFEAPNGCMPSGYSADGDAHLTEDGVKLWFRVLRNYAQSQEMQAKSHSLLK